ncbi:hypothetical protein NQZ68_025258 [Dissostichus eleginoides]|nr:hypothetical protein NQZ68_025258 [Dissostichus eleginoides]
MPRFTPAVSSLLWESLISTRFKAFCVIVEYDEKLAGEKSSPPNPPAETSPMSCPLTGCQIAVCSPGYTELGALTERQRNFLRRCEKQKNRR